MEAEAQEMTDPVDLDEERRRRAPVRQFICAECDFRIFHLYDDGSVVCANCETYATNIACAEVEIVALH